ncbi:hypothetical protein ACFQ0M_23700 [Kitasatospora aburaviensis]
MDAADAIDGGEQLVDHGLGGGAFGRETEGFGGLAEDGDALLDDAEGLHLLVGPHLDYLISFSLLRVVGGGAEASFEAETGM